MARRQRQLVAIGLNLLLLLSNVWPLALPLARVEPLVLGLPFALAWTFFTVLASFGVLLWLFRAEARER